MRVVGRMILHVASFLTLYAESERAPYCRHGRPASVIKAVAMSHVGWPGPAIIPGCCAAPSGWDLNRGSVPVRIPVNLYPKMRWVLRSMMLHLRLGRTLQPVNAVLRELGLDNPILSFVAPCSILVADSVLVKFLWVSDLTSHVSVRERAMLSKYVRLRMSCNLSKRGAVSRVRLCEATEVLADRRAQYL